jgi:ubiquinone/menaquinone biosynthesis C-methylase UbiE
MQRLELGEDWHRALAEDPEEAVKNFEFAYGMIAWALRPLRGLVLDIGGGTGVAREYLDDSVEYVNIDPSRVWLSETWDRLATRFPKLLEPMAFVRGVGEQLPFRDGVFDATLTIRSLNLAARPDLVVREAHRVLKPGGAFVAVVQFIEPRWSDLPADPLRRRPRLALRKVKYRLRRRPWPVQSDHTRITESQLTAWTDRRFALRERRWATSEDGWWAPWRGPEPSSVLVCRFEKL